MAVPNALTLDFVKQYAGGVSIAPRLEVDLAPGSVLVLFGPSGAGKTTVVKAIAGLAPPDRGIVRFAGETWTDVERGIHVSPQRRRVGLVFQEAALFPHLTARENIAFGLASRADDTRRKRVTELASMLGIDVVLDRAARSLSGGEAQRVALARAAAIAPKMLLLDEPFASVDAPTRSRLRRDVGELLRRTSTPAVMVTHDRTDAIAMGDFLAVIVDGRVRQLGTVADVFSRPADLDVAQSVGIESVVPATIAGEEEGMLTLRSGATTLRAVDRGAHGMSGAVYACIRAEDVTLERVAAGGSARNHLPAEVVAIDPEGAIERVTLDCGFRLVALVTRQSREEMALAPGARVSAAVKATSIHLVERR